MSKSTVVSLAGQLPGRRGSQWLSAGARDSDRDWACDREDTQGACQGWDAGYLSLGADTALCSQGPLARSGAALALFEVILPASDGHLLKRVNYATEVNHDEANRKEIPPTAATCPGVPCRSAGPVGKGRSG